MVPNTEIGPIAPFVDTRSSVLEVDGCLVLVDPFDIRIDLSVREKRLEGIYIKVLCLKCVALLILK